MTMISKRRCAALLGSAVLGLAGCAGVDRGSGAAGEDLALDVPGWRLERAASVGGEAADERSMLYSAQIVSEDPEGRFYVLNMGDRRIAVFDSAGRFVRTLGNRGHGPGEFNSPIALAPAGDEMYVLDAVPARLMRYRRNDGAFVGDLPLEAKSSVPMRMEVGRDGRVAVELKPMSPRTSEVTTASLVGWVDAAGGITPMVDLDSVTRLRHNTDTPQGTRSLVMDAPFAPRPVWTLDGHGGVLFGHGREYIVYHATPAGRALAFRGDGEAAAVTQVDRDGFLSSVRGRQLRDVQFPERKGFFGRLVVDPQGLVWVQRPGESLTETWEVRTLDGRRLGRLQVPAGMRVLAVTPHSLYVVQKDELDVETLHRYRLLRRG
jgi:hypothetical protein